MGIRTKNMAGREREREREKERERERDRDRGRLRTENGRWEPHMGHMGNLDQEHELPNHHYIFYGMFGALYMCFFHQGLQSLKHPTVRTYSGCFV